jgi:hypothetical protein
MTTRLDPTRPQRLAKSSVAWTRRVIPALDVAGVGDDHDFDFGQRFGGEFIPSPDVRYGSPAPALTVPQRLHGVEGGGPTGRPDAEAEADGDRHREASHDRPERDLRRERGQEDEQQPAHRHGEQHPEVDTLFRRTSRRSPAAASLPPSPPASRTPFRKSATSIERTSDS